MKKGDIRKQEILSTAENLFCRKGYENTSIQDILDRLNTSKGSFYHHFVSKESVLEGICRNRAAEVFLAVIPQINIYDDTLKRLNTLLTGMIPFSDEKISFLLMILRIFNLPEGRTVRQTYSDALSEQFRPTAEELIRTGHQEGIIYTEQPDLSAELVLIIVNRLWIRIGEEIVSAENENREPDITELLRITDQYRLVIERTLSLPYGTAVLTDIPALQFMIRQVHNHWSNEPVNV